MVEIRRRAAAFAAEWAGETYERGESQTFWTDFLRIFGVERRRVASFEARARRLSTGNHGFIDMLWRGMLLVEQKSAGKDLDGATDQAFDYLDSLSDAEFPKAVVVSDFSRIRLTIFDGKFAGETQIIETKNLALEIDRFAFLAGYVQRDYTKRQEEEVNAKAVKLIGDLYAEVLRDKYPEHVASLFVTRLLFLLFGDDAGLWQRGLFTDVVESTPEDGEALTGVLGSLFRNLDRAPEDRPDKVNEYVAQFPWVNGHIFNESIEIPEFDGAMRKKLLACCDFDWGAISPAIFGSMFQIAKSKIDRRERGEHYTSEKRILATIRPLFLDELRDQLDKAGKDLTKLQVLRKQLSRYDVRLWELLGGYVPGDATARTRNSHPDEGRSARTPDAYRLRCSRHVGCFPGTVLRDRDRRVSLALGRSCVLLGRSPVEHEAQPRVWQSTRPPTYQGRCDF